MRGEKTKILVVDDVPRNLELLKAILTVADYEVVIARDGEEALRLVQQDPPDLVLLDVMMPKLDGFSLCAKLKESEETRLIPVILITPSEGIEERIRGIEAGSDDFLRRPVNRVELLARARSLIRQKRLNEELVALENAIMALATAIEAKDPYAEGHLERVVAYALALAGEAGLSERERDLLRKGAVLHDVGKIGIRESVLLKEGPLTEEESEHMRVHPVVGERICQPLRSPLIQDVVRHHHERYDGKGYPDGLVGKEIPLAARIMAIADAYDALTSDRPYRRRLSPRQAIATLRKEAGKQFDPELALTFIDLAKRLPEP